MFAGTGEVQETLHCFLTANIFSYSDEAAQIVDLTPTRNVLNQECLTRQTEIRQKAMHHISASEYQRVGQTLQKLISNLEEL